MVAEGLRKSHGTAKVLDGLDLVVPRATVCGLLGPNGTGRTTTAGILSTLLAPDEGRAEAAGFDAVRNAAQVRHLSSTAAATRELFRNPGRGGDSWIAQHATAMAVLRPLVFIAAPFPPAVNRYRHLTS